MGGVLPAGGRRKLLEVRPEWPQGKARQGWAQMVPVEEAGWAQLHGCFPVPQPHYHGDTAGCLACRLRGDLPHPCLPKPAPNHMSPCGLPPLPQAGRQWLLEGPEPSGVGSETQAGQDPSSVP